MVEIDTVFGVRWCVMGTRLLINTVLGVGLGGLCSWDNVEMSCT